MRNPLYIFECYAYIHKLFCKHFSVFCVNHYIMVFILSCKEVCFFLILLKIWTKGRGKTYTYTLTEWYLIVCRLIWHKLDLQCSIWICARRLLKSRLVFYSVKFRWDLFVFIFCNYTLTFRKILLLITVWYLKM